MRKIILLLITLVGFAFLVGCSRATQTPDMSQDGVEKAGALSPTQTPTEMIEAALDSGSEADAAESQSNQTSSEMEVVPEEPDYCVECHSDQQMLIDTGKPQEERVVESEGEG